MPEVLRRNGCKIHFYASDGNEQIHVHCRKGEKKGKFFLLKSSKEIIPWITFKMNSKDIADVTEIINQNYFFILEMWNKYF